VLSMMIITWLRCGRYWREGDNDFGFWILDLDFGFWILDFGFWILDFGFWIWDSLGCVVENYGQGIFHF
jgi:hypothetical protein